MIDKKYKQYGTKYMIVKKFHDHRPLSIIQSVQNIFSIAINKNKSLQIIKTPYIDDTSNIDYFYWELMVDNIIVTPSSENIEQYCLLLPKIQATNEEDTSNAILSQIYGCIDSQWNELSRGKGFVLPKDM